MKEGATRKAESDPKVDADMRIIGRLGIGFVGFVAIFVEQFWINSDFPGQRGPRPR